MIVLVWFELSHHGAVKKYAVIQSVHDVIDCDCAQLVFVKDNLIGCRVKVG